MKQVGLSAVLKFAGDAAVAGMRRASGAFTDLNRSAAALRSGMGDIKAGMVGMASSGLWAGAAAGYTVKKFADFDGQMGAVKAVLGSAAKKSFPMLTAEAQKLGATTSFTATQAAEAMENLARSGMDAQQIMSAIGPTLAAAAAEGMDLGTAADIVASNIKAFGLKSKDAAMVADTLAYVSAKTNTNMVSLQEGLKFVGPIAAGMKIPIQDAAGALGVLADVGLKGSIGGTGLKNALIKIASGAKGGKVQVGKFSVAVKKTEAGGVDLAGTMLDITKALSNITDPLERTNAGMKLLGLRGQGAASAFAALDKDKVAVLFENMAQKAKGTAAEMQRMRLDNLKGDFTLLSSAIDGVVNAMGGALSGSVRDVIGRGGVGGLTGGLSQAATALQYFGDHADDVMDKGFGEKKVRIKGVSLAMSEFIRGALLGFKEVKTFFGGVINTIKEVAGWFGYVGSDGTKELARLATKAVGLSIGMGGIGLALKGVTKLFGPFARIGLGAFKMLSAGMRPLLVGMAKFTGGVFGRILDKAGMAKKLPGAAGALGKALGGLEKMTAQPVRVVNFDEASGGMLGRGGVGGAGAGAGGAIAQARAGLAGFVSRFGRVGAFLNSGLSNLAKGGVAAVAGKLGIMAGAVGAAGLAGYKFGQWLDQKFGISEKLGNALHNLFNSAKIAAEKEKTRAWNAEVVNNTAKEMAMSFSQMAIAGRKQIQIHGKKGPKTVELTREMASKRLIEFMKSQDANQAQIDKTMAAVGALLSNIPEKIVVDNKVTVDGKVVASATGKAKVEGKERGAKPSKRAAAVGAAP